MYIERLKWKEVKRKGEKKKKIQVQAEGKKEEERVILSRS